MAFSTVDKAIVAGIGMLLLVLNNLGALGLPAVDMWWVNLVIAVLTPVAVYLKANKPPAA